MDADTTVPDLGPMMQAFVERSRQTYENVRALRREIYEIAREDLADGDEPVIIRSRFVELAAASFTRLDVPGSDDERAADALLEAADDAIEGRPLGRCPELFAADGPDAPPLARLVASLANVPAGDPDDDESTP